LRGASKLIPDLQGTQLNYAINLLYSIRNDSKVAPAKKQYKPTPKGSKKGPKTVTTLSLQELQHFDKRSHQSPKVIPPRIQFKWVAYAKGV
jgi:hypothetical protein